ncbi:VOC family protein [Roseivirga echinicomitans]|uniref:VOC domain-containing protein n=1 Tax=Roseivirga echinicomitans TaxID=296218 RepID=A0A150X269_9BACT|nr:VOC family protein [Roseivirga echinicomitans]KYG72815.1 hypothetical protein AWN68_08925 [Roseivirga echinicomitans]
MKSKALTIVLIAAFLMGCGTPEKFSNELGSLAAFAEMVDSGAKQIAFSEPMTAAEMDAFLPMAEAIADKYGVKLVQETELIKTDLFDAEIAEGKAILILYKGNSYEAYIQLKADRSSLEKSGLYEGAERQEIARRLGCLLGYSAKGINDKLTANTNYSRLTDFGIKASNVFLYYKDIQKATEFYTEVMGLAIVAQYDNANILKISNTSFLTLVDAAKGMHSADEPKSVAVAFLTRQLAEWYDYLQEKKVEIKYTYKPKEGGPHDGFVAIDPEGYLLEFEVFKQDQENENFIPYLANTHDVLTTANHKGTTLGFHASITWLYYKDLLPLQNFYENVMGFELAADQVWTKIYRTTDDSYIGLVDVSRGMHSYAKDKAVNVGFIVNDLEGWFNYVQGQKPFELRENTISKDEEGKYSGFVGYDPGNYFLEFDSFNEHPANKQLLKELGSN